MKKDNADQIDNFPELLLSLKTILLNSYTRDGKKMSSARHHTCGYKGNAH